jgi:hypothetical protein
MGKKTNRGGEFDQSLSKTLNNSHTLINVFKKKKERKLSKWDFWENINVAE